jgi:cell wall-associated NlpC family hydrolase/nucleoid-associated protein YgaU
MDPMSPSTWPTRVTNRLAALAQSTSAWRAQHAESLMSSGLIRPLADRLGLGDRGLLRPMAEAVEQRPSLTARRRRLSGARRIDPATPAHLRPSVTRVGFHGLMVAVGLTAAVTVWSGATDTFQLGESQTGQIAAIEAAAETPDETIALAEETTAVTVTAAPGKPAIQPLVRTIQEGDTLRSLAAEFSVSMSTILASNKLDNPDLIRPGQEIVIPPVDGVVAEVRQGETLGQLAERFGAQVEDVAQANALPNDASQAVPHERVVVPGKDAAERAIGVARREGNGEPAGNSVGSVDPSAAAKPNALTYEVQEGDTIGQLATQFGVSIWTILSANNLPDADLIRPGMSLKVLPVNGVEHEIQAGESLSDIAAFYKVDLGPLIDFNALADPDNLRVGARLTIPGAERPQPTYSLAGASAPAPVVAAAPAAASRPAAVANAQRPAAQSTLAQAKPQAPAAQSKPAAAKPQAAVAQAKPQAKPATTAAAKPQAPGTNRLSAAAVSAPSSIVTGGGNGSSVVSAAMRHLGARYVFGGTSPSGFDCSGFVWYVHKAMGRPVSRGLWGQMNGGPRIALSALQPGDTVFFANTYMPGLSHAGIYIGGGRFIHASDESSGVKISSLSDSYWGPRYIGASRLY